MPIVMAREGLVSVILVGIHGNSVTRRLRVVTRFFHLNGVVEWDSTLEDHKFPDGGRIDVVAFG